MRKRTLAREIALKILYQIDINHYVPQEVFENYWKDNIVDKEVKEFAEKIVNGTIQNLSRINETVSKYAENWDLNRMAVIDRNILRFATFELLYMDDIPPKVTINEAVNIAKKYSQEESGKFVNGILDKISHTESCSSKKDSQQSGA